jgi:hypothetical protein
MQTLDHKMQNLMHKRHANIKSTLGVFCSFEPYLLEWGLEFLLYLLAFMSNFLKTLTIPKGKVTTQPWLSVKSITQGKPWYLVQLWSCMTNWNKERTFFIVASLGILVYHIIINIIQYSIKIELLLSIVDFVRKNCPFWVINLLYTRLNRSIYMLHTHHDQTLDSNTKTLVVMSKSWY